MDKLYLSKTYVDDLKNTINQVINIEKLKNTSILITGATGTIGSFIVDTLLQYNAEADAKIVVYAAGRNIMRMREKFGEKKGLFFLPYDLDKQIVFDVCPEYIIHAAGNAFPRAFSRNPVGTIIGNVLGTYALLEYGRSHRTKKFLYVSSGEVYGQSVLDKYSFTEDYSGYVDPVSARSCYPNSKRAAETLCVSYTKQYGLVTLIARPCHTYGPGISENDNRANAQFIRNGLDGKDIVLKSRGTQIRSYNYIVDCVSAMLTILINGKSCEAYNVANSKAICTIAEFAGIVADVVKCEVIFEESSELDIEDQTPIKRQILNTKKLEELGWKEIFSVEEGIKHTIKILRGE